MDLESHIQHNHYVIYIKLLNLQHIKLMLNWVIK